MIQHSLLKTREEQLQMYMQLFFYHSILTCVEIIFQPSSPFAHHQFRDNASRELRRHHCVDRMFKRNSTVLQISGAKALKPKREFLKEVTPSIIQF